ncbi:unnamed protein product [Toxocara canis]|uniref:Mediator of RNA polymerase II transcription subunit 13 n=1 Tax=Toxocara canis TaxID=6265 RepID=A0A183U7W4_TOXCA|nr:unnamed protein product [Toxocara canis]
MLSVYEYLVSCKPFILAPPPPVMQRSSGEIMQFNTDETVLFVSYCLIGNDWLAATVTDHQGHLLDNCLINLRLKPDHKRWMNLITYWELWLTTE